MKINRDWRIKRLSEHKLKRTSILLCLMMFGLFLICGTSQASPIYGESAVGELSGSRAATATDELIIGGDGSKWQNLSIGWNIQDIGEGQWKYAYTFTGIDKDISHFTLDITDDAFDDPFAVTDVSPYGSVVKGDFDDITGAVKFDFGSGSLSTFIYSFQSNRAPVYGDFYLKDGVTGSSLLYAKNYGFGDETYENSTYYIARPNGSTTEPVPEPATIALLGIGLAGLAAAAVRRRLRRAGK